MDTTPPNTPCTGENPTHSTPLKNDNGASRVTIARCDSYDTGSDASSQIFTHILPVFRIFREPTKMTWRSAVNRSNCVPSCYSFLGRYTLNAVLLNLRWYGRNYCPLLSMCATRINIVMFLLPTSNFSLAQTLRANKSMTFKDFCSISAFAHEYGFHMLIILL